VSECEIERSVRVCLRVYIHVSEGVDGRVDDSCANSHMCVYDIDVCVCYRCVCML